MRPVWYTDGACSANGTDRAKGGFGVVCVDADTDELIYQYQEFHEGTTNNRMEMMAIIHAVKQAYANPFTRFIPLIRSDSLYAVNTFTSWMYSWQRNGWKRSGNKTPENLDLVQEYYLLQERGFIANLEHVKGHAGNKWNEYCDALATGKQKI